MNSSDFEWLKFTLSNIQKDIIELKNDAKQARSESLETKQLAMNLRFKFGFLASAFGGVAGLLVKVFFG